MKRFLAFAFILLCCACEKNVIDTEYDPDYVFHDDYYIVEKEHHSLETIYSNHFLIIKEKDKEAVMADLEANGFKIVTEPYKWIYYATEGNDADETLSKCVALTVEGHKSISLIRKVIYSNHMYRNQAGETIGKSNTFLIKFTKNQRDAQMIKLKEYQKMHKFLILGDASSEYFRLACTNETTGNCVEMANWFVEAAGFKTAEPEFPEISADTETDTETDTDTETETDNQQQ